MSVEIERKFLVKGDYKSQASHSYYIEQGYICRGSGRTVRVRIRDDKGFLTIKGPSLDGGLSRYEWEKEISLQEARELMLLCDPSIISKHRYLVPFKGHVFEVDEFHGDNQGLTVAEVELGDTLEFFAHPSWLGEEVTGDGHYTNASLSKFPFKDW